MRGAIRRREILAHPFVTVRCFGWSVFVRAIVAGRGSTFLSLLSESAKPRRAAVPEPLARCMAFEERAQRLYAEIARRFVDAPQVADLFETLSRQEAHHAELLRVCGELATQAPGIWRVRSEGRCWAIIERAQGKLAQEEARAREIATVNDALRAAIRIEISEVNDAFALAIEATDSVFVRTLEAFCTAEDEHLRYLHDRILVLAPELASEAQQLLSSSPSSRLSGG